MSLTDIEKARLDAAAHLFPVYRTASMLEPYVKLGGENPDYIWQKGHIYAWSESNTAYEPCWWLTPTGASAATGTWLGAERVANLLRDRPFDPDWLKQVVVSEALMP